MTTRTIQCESCDFVGKLTYKEGLFGKADISYCPACGSDISEEYNVEDEEEDEE